MLRRWQSTGSPTAAVAEEKLGSLRVHCRSVPAGRTTLCALALRVKPSNRVARVAQSPYFITPPQSHAPSFWCLVLPSLALVLRSLSQVWAEVNREWLK